MTQIIVPIVVAIGGPVVMRLLSYFSKERQERHDWEERVGRLEERMRRQEEGMREFMLLALKSVITNRELSEQARLDAYDGYKSLGGNSWVDAYVMKYLKSIGD
jgi:hypothetical protein